MYQGVLSFHSRSRKLCAAAERTSQSKQQQTSQDSQSSGNSSPEWSDGEDSDESQDPSWTGRRRAQRSRKAGTRRRKSPSAGDSDPKPSDKGAPETCPEPTDVPEVDDTKKYRGVTRKYACLSMATWGTLYASDDIPTVADSQHQIRSCSSYACAKAS